jgi:hypothetical protein
MPTPADFDARLRVSFSFPHPSIDLGRAVLEGDVRPVSVRLPLSMANRHGLIAGATGTGKTKTLQHLAEQFSRAGVPVFLADVKGDLAGLCRPGTPSPGVAQRAESLGISWAPWSPPTQLWSLTGRGGAQLRASVSSFGPLLLSRVMDLNDTQSSVLSLVFKLCDDEGLLLLDLPDLRAVLQWIVTPEAAPLLARYGGLSKATVGVLQRKLVELEAQGAEHFLGEPELDLGDFLALDASGHGVVNVLDLSDIQRQPKLFSTSMLWLLAELYERLPERGDADRPVLAFFFDEAHLLFDDAPKALLQQVEQVVRLIRSKGVGVYFVTQLPTDVPESVLAQLGHRLQHALRAFTPKDRKAIKLTAENFPETADYDVAATLTQLEIGEALCSVLNPRGAPSPTVVARIAPPASRMGPLAPDERELLLVGAPNVDKYSARIDRESAREMLLVSVEDAPPPVRSPQPSVWADEPPPSSSSDSLWGAPPPPRPLPDLHPRTTRSAAPRAPRRAAPKDPMTQFLGSTAGRTLQRELVRGVFGLLKRR